MRFINLRYFKKFIFEQGCIPWFIRKRFEKQIWSIQARFNFVRKKSYLSLSTNTEKPEMTFLIAHKDCAQFLGMCAKSIKQNTRRFSYKIIIADDESDDNEFEKLLELKDSSMEIHRFSTRHGHPFTLEWLYHRCDSKYAVILDQDSILISPCWERLFDEFEHNKELIMLGVRDAARNRFSPDMLHPSFIIIDKERCQQRLRAPLFYGDRPNYSDYKIGKQELVHSLTCKALDHNPLSVSYLDTYPTKYSRGSVGYFKSVENGIFYHQWFSGRISNLQDEDKIDGSPVKGIRDGINSFLNDYKQKNIDYSPFNHEQSTF